MSRKLTKNALLDIAKQKLENAHRVLRAHEILWNDRWESAKNPFEAINDYLSEDFRKIRKPIIDNVISLRQEIIYLGQLRHKILDKNAYSDIARSNKNQAERSSRIRKSSI